MSCVELDTHGLDRVAFGWFVFGWVGLGWSSLDCLGVGWLFVWLGLAFGRPSGMLMGELGHPQSILDKSRE